MNRLMWMAIAMIWIMPAAPSWSEQAAQWTITLREDEASIQIDGDVKIECLTASMDAVTALGFEEMTASQIVTAKQTVAKRGTVLVAREQEGTVTLLSPRPVPLNTLVVFLKHLKSASIKHIAFETLPPVPAATDQDGEDEPVAPRGTKS